MVNSAFPCGRVYNGHQENQVTRFPAILIPELMMALPLLPLPLIESAFTLDWVGRFVYNTVSELGDGPIDVIVVGGGSFGPIVADHLFQLDDPKQSPRRIVVLDSGPHALLEHYQNLPSVGLGIGNFPDPVPPNPQTPNIPWVA